MSVDIFSRKCYVDLMDQSRPTLFLDFDGVLNTPEFTNMFGARLNPNKVNLLWQILQQSNCQIVLSTAWRCHPLDKIKEEFHCFGFRDKIEDNVVDEIMKRIVGVTDDLKFLKLSAEKQRQFEINGFVSDNDLSKWVAVDDLQLNLGDDNFVKTEEDVGLTLNLVDVIIKKLGE